MALKGIAEKFYHNKNTDNVTNTDNITNALAIGIIYPMKLIIFHLMEKLKPKQWLTNTDNVTNTNNVTNTDNVTSANNVTEAENVTKYSSHQV